MKKLVLTFLFSCFSLLVLKAQNLKSFQFYNQKGKAVNFDQVVKACLDYDVILFGEHHNNSTNHWLQLQLLKQLHQKKGKQLVLGAEMFERDNQEGLNRYLSHQIDDNELKNQVRLWSNYKTDYKPLVDFAQKHQLQFIATNIPRKYASQVAKFGVESLDTLTNLTKKDLIALPFPIDYSAPGYPEMLEMMGDHAGAKAKQFVAAQAIKDATMAESILKNRKEGQLFLHFNGDYHSKQFGGIYWYLKNYQPTLKVAVIQILESDEITLELKKSKEDSTILTDFTLVLPSDTNKTY